MDDVRRQLDELRRARQPRPASMVSRQHAQIGGLAGVLGGGETRCCGRAYWLIETPVDQVCAAHGLKAPRPPASLPYPRDLPAGVTPPGIDPRRTVVLDIETGGFAGTPIFLIGLVLLDQQPICVRQFLARDYPEEEAILRAMAETARSRDTWITFNGKSFDAPMLHDRATLHRIRLTPPRLHLDLLHAARRTWRGVLPNFRLATLEREILKHERVGDVPSSDVPDLFHHFMRTGNAAPLRPVLEHNRIDLVSSLELLVRLAGTLPKE